MYNKKISWPKTSIRKNESVEGETIEQKIDRIVQNKEPITDGAPLIYTERNEGIQAGFNIKTDRFEVATEVMDKIHKTEIAKRQERHNPKVIEMDTKGESAGGTND